MIKIKGVLDALGELKLRGMHARFNEIACKKLARCGKSYPLLASLIQAKRIYW